jgi:sugar phosphate isomerase/epimerase
MKISICSFSFEALFSKDEMDIFEYLVQVKDRYGLATADIWNRMLESTDEDYVTGVRQSMDEKGLKLVNMCVDGAHVWEPDPKKRAKLGANAMAHLRAAVVLGAASVRIDMGGREETMTDEQFDVTVETYKKYADFAVENGFLVGPENHTNASKVAENMVKVAEAVDHPAFGVLVHLDRWAGDGDEGDRACAPWAMHTHIAAGITGEILERKMKILQSAGYDRYWGVERHSEQDVYENVDRQVDEVRTAIARLEEG